MATIAERRAVALSDEVLELQCRAFRLQQAISLKAGAKMGQLMSDLSEAWTSVQTEWQRMNPSQAAA